MSSQVVAGGTLEGSATTKHQTDLVPTMVDWTETYRPRSLSELRGNNKARDKLKQWADTWDDHREAVVIYGSPGVGKTSAAHALATDMGWETVELNASDQRTGDVIERFAGRAAMNATLAGSLSGGGASGGDTASRQLVILDEADNIHGNYDRGGKAAITKLVKNSGQPIILIANEFYEMSRGLRNACQDIEFRDVGSRSIVPALRDICRHEGVEYDDAALEVIAEINSGDLRGAVKDLQAAAEGREKITEENVVTSERDKSMGIFPFLDAVLKEESAKAALEASYQVDETPDDLTKWIEDNMLAVYDPSETARAYDFLANADVWLGRVRATQNYSYWRYAGDNTAGGVAAAREGTKGGWTRYGRPQFWPGSNNTADEVCQQIAERGGMSIGVARRSVLPFLSAMTHHCKPRELTVTMAAAYEFDESHVSFVTGSGESTNKVQSIVEDAQQLREDAIEANAGGAFAGTTAENEATNETEATTATAETDETDQPEVALADSDGSSAAADDLESEDDDNQAGLSDFL